MRDERIYLETSNTRLAQYCIDVTMLAATLQDQNVILPGGHIIVDQRQIFIEPSGYFRTLEDIENVWFRIPEQDRLVALRDIFTVRRGYRDPPARLAYFNGQETIVLAVTMRAGQNVLQFGPRLKERVRRIEAQLPVGYRFEMATYQPEPVQHAVDDVTRSLYQTLGIVLVVTLVFMGLREGLIVGLMIPVTTLGTLVIMRAIGVELHRVSLAAMIISLGMLVSNFVAVAEEIRRRLGTGQERCKAAKDAGRILAVPLSVATLTTVIAFTPPLLTQDEAGEYTRSLSLVIAITLIGSWVLAMTTVPLLCMHFIKTPEHPSSEDEMLGRRMFRVYRRLLELLLRFRIAVPVVLAILIAVGVWLIALVPEQFFPRSERAEFMIYVDLPAGASLLDTDRTVSALVDWLVDEEVNPEVERTIAYVGIGGPRFFLTVAPIDPTPHRGFLVVGLDSHEQVQPMIRKTREHMLREHGEARVRIATPFLGYVETGLVELRLSGPDAKQLYALGRELEFLMHEVEGAYDIHNNWENLIFKARVVVDQARARRSGVSSRDIALSLNAFFDQEPVTGFLDDDIVIPIAVRGEESERHSLQRLNSVNVHSARSGANVPLLQVAELEPVVDFGSIQRRNQQRTVTIAAKHRHWTAVEFEAALEERLQQFFANLPGGYTWEWGGETEASQEARAALFEHVPLALFAIIALLVWQFNSFRRPLIIALTIPLAFVGAAIGLLASGSWFGFMSILGFLSLGGIIVNYAILIISSIDEQRQEEQEDFQALIRGAQLRLRPILMMALTTILGLAPLILTGDVLFYDMANVIAFGLGFGMLLTLTTVPVLYALLLRIPNPDKKRGEKDK